MILVIMINTVLIGSLLISAILAVSAEEYARNYVVGYDGAYYNLQQQPLPFSYGPTNMRQARSEQSYGYDIFMPTGPTEIVQSYLSQYADIATNVISTLQDRRLLPTFLKTVIGFLVNAFGAVVRAIPIDKLMFWRMGGWIKYETKPSNIILNLVCDQLLITNNMKVVESLNLNGKIKGIYKGDILILIIGNSVQETRKIKFQIRSELSQCLEELGRRFPLVEHNSMQTKNAVQQPQYRNIDEVIRCAIEMQEGQDAVPVSLPPSFANFMKICLLDPSFPSLVNETQKFLEGKEGQKNKK